MHILFLFLQLLAWSGLTLAKHRDSKHYDRIKDLTEVAKSTDELVFTITADEFQARRSRHQGAGGLIWKSDGCSHAPDNPFGWDFKNSCDRHDFAYHNYKAQGRFSSPNKKRIDGNFKKDLLDQCRREGKAMNRCRFVAKIYYNAVRLFSRKRSLAGRIDMGLLEESEDEDWDEEEDQEAGVGAEDEAVKIT